MIEFQLANGLNLERKESKKLRILLLFFFFFLRWKERRSSRMVELEIGKSIQIGCS